MTGQKFQSYYHSDSAKLDGMDKFGGTISDNKYINTDTIISLEELKEYHVNSYQRNYWKINHNEIYELITDSGYYYIKNT